MEMNIDALKLFIEKIKSIGFLQRIFSWGKVKVELVDAAADLQKMITTSAYLSESLQKLENENQSLNKDLLNAKDSGFRLESETTRLQGLITENLNKLATVSAELAAANQNIKSITENYNTVLGEKALMAENSKNLANSFQDISGKLSASEELNKGLSERKVELETELEKMKYKMQLLDGELVETKKANTQLTVEEGERKKKFDQDVSTLNSIKDKIEKDREEEVNGRNQKEIDRLVKLKETWAKHQENAKNQIKIICNKHIVEYLEKVPFSGTPDNTLKICDEYVIFDAKSPANDDLSNFPNYIKGQAENAKKYAKQDDVKKDIFFVVPSNTLEILNTFVYNMADYNVFVISMDALEQIIINLKKIEEYEFTEQLSPEERENICRILGKFAHLTKRRIQIDSFFAKQFIELAYKSESDLPKEILEKVIEFERSEKLNPPIEKRAKSISIKDLEKDNQKLNSEVYSKGIKTEDELLSDVINDLPLYTDKDQLENEVKNTNKKNSKNTD